MPASQQYLDLMGRVLKADPDNPAVQRLAVAAADLADKPVTRTRMLQVVAAADVLDPGVRAILAGDRNDRVRHAVWSRPDWPLADVLAMIEAEASPLVQLTALARDDLPEATVRRLVRPQARVVAEAVVQHAARVPADLVVAAMLTLEPRVVEAQRNGIPDSEAARYVAAATQPHVAATLAYDLDVPVPVRVAALQSPTLTAGQVTEVLVSLASEAALDAWHPDGARAQVGNALELSRLLVDLATLRPDLCDAAVQAGQALYEWRLGYKHSGFTDAVQRARSIDQTVGRKLLAEACTVDQALEAWRSLTPAQRTVKTAVAYLASGWCGPEMFDEIVDYLPDSSPEGLAALAAQWPKNNRPRPWMVRHPDLYVATLRNCAETYTLKSQLAGVEQDGGDELLAAVFADVLAQPEKWPASAAQLLISHADLPVEALLAAPVGDLVAATADSSGDRPNLLAALVAGLSRLDTADRELLDLRSRALSSMLEEKVSLVDLVDAVTAAAG